MIPPLAIIQARMGSKRLPGKVLMEVGGRSLVRRAWSASCAAFGEEHVVFTVPAHDTKLIQHIDAFGGIVEEWEGDENDVLGRFYVAAHKYRWHPDSVLLRVTPDDPFKDPARMQRVARGERLDVERSGEAFTLAMLDYWQHSEPSRSYGFRFDSPIPREHIGDLIPGDPPPCPRGRGWTVDTTDDLIAARKLDAKLEAEALRRDEALWRSEDPLWAL